MNTENDSSHSELKTFYRKDFVWDNKKYILKQEVTCTEVFQDEIWTYECSKFGLRTFSSSQEEALELFDEEFALLYLEFFDEDDSNLTEKGIELKKLLKEGILEVQNIG